MLLKRALFAVLFLTLTFAVGGRVAQIGACGVRTQNGLLVSDKKLWQKYTGRFLTCHSGWMGISRSFPEEKKRVKRVIFRLGDKKLQAKMFWDKSPVVVRFGYQYESGGKILVYYLAPEVVGVENKADIKSEEEKRLGIVINQIMAGLSGMGRTSREKEIGDWVSSGRSLRDMGLAVKWR